MMKMKKWFPALLALILAAGMLAGCSSPSTTYEASASYEMDAAYDAGNGVLHAELAGSDASAKSRGADPISLPENRKWIITMNLSAETEDLDATLEALNRQISTLNGYVESQNIMNTASYRRARSASLSVRIPAEQADIFVAELGGMANIVSNARNVQDVTLAYSDTEGRVNALKAEEQRLLELMAQAETMSDLLEVEGRLTEVRYQLENYASTLRLYDNQIDYATVTLYISEVEKYTPVEEPTFWERITEGLADSVVALGNNMVDLLAWVIVNLPFLVVWGLVIWAAAAIGKRALRKRKAKKESKKQEK